MNLSFSFAHYILLINLILVIFISMVVMFYLFKENAPFPLFIINILTNPVTRLLTYLFIYFVSFYNPVISLLLLFGVIIIHIDIINFNFI